MNKENKENERLIRIQELCQGMCALEKYPH